jgi:hypothetical protein
MHISGFNTERDKIPQEKYTKVHAESLEIELNYSSSILIFL